MQTVFLGVESAARRGVDSWCRSDSQEIWDGVDFSVCFRRRVIDGILPATFIALSILSLVVMVIYRLALHFRRPAVPIPLSTSATRRLSSSSRRPRSVSISSVRSEAEIKTSGPMAIAEAENEVIFRVVEEESPDLTPEDMIILSGGEKAKGGSKGVRVNGNGYSSLRDEVEDIEDNDHVVLPLSFGMILRALSRNKKDVINVFGSAATLGLLVWRLVESRKIIGGNWFILTVAAWAWTFVLTVVKLSLSFSSKLEQIQSPTSPLRLSEHYETLEYHVTPFYLLYLFISFFDLRSSILVYYDHPSTFDTMLHEAVIFALVATLFIIEILAPRNSRFSSTSSKDRTAPDVATSGGEGPIMPPAPQMNACLLSLATFSFVDQYMYKTAFGSEKYALETVPDLRPDDKTARIVLSYRRDCAVLNDPTTPKSSHWGLTAKLVWHFRSQLAAQQFYAYIKAFVIAIPPLFLKALLAHISKRNRGEEAPMHVAILYAFAMFVFQVVGSLASSQSLYIGRRICINLRSIIVSEIFTKALRRKDQAGKSAEEVELDDKGIEITKEKTEDELEKANSGKIMNLISVDTFRLSEVAGYLHFLYPELSLTIVITIFLLFQIIGLSAIAGLTVLVLVTPITAWISKLFYVYQQRLLTAADQRLNLSNEIISSIRVVKYFAWEAKFAEMMSVAREKELRALWLRSLTMIGSGITMFGAPVLVSVATFVFHTEYLHRDLTAETAFTALALFNILRGPLEMITDMVINILNAHVSLKRIDEFLSEEETEKYSVIKVATRADDPIVGFKNGSFTWSDASTAQEDDTVFRIKDLKLSFPPGQLSIILGPVGSGKTTLLLSLLGETNVLSGSSYLPSPVVRATGEDPSFLTETTSYCSQAPFLQSATIKENILFGAVLNQRRYEEVLRCCSLGVDLDSLALGDETEVGEKGTVLSGGQKARISLARAIYSSAKYVLLDDVLSAVDSHTAQHLVANCLRGEIMRHRTCVLVTHAVDLCLPVASFVVTMDNGTITSADSPARTIASGHADLLVDHEHDTATSPPAPIIDEEVLSEEALLEAKKKAEKLKLIQDETQSEGSVSMQVYVLYIKAMGGWTLLAVSLLIFFGAQASEIAVSLALRYWAGSYDDNSQSIGTLFSTTFHHSLSRYRSIPIFFSATISTSTRLISSIVPAPSTQSVLSTSSTSIVEEVAIQKVGGNDDTRYWLLVYVGLAGINLLFYGARVGFFLWQGLVASRVLYSGLIARIMGSPIRFFDSVPLGRIINRLSKDMETIDQDVAMSMMFLLLEIFGTVGILLTISTVLPQFLFAAVVIVLSYWFIGYIYLASSRELKRSESVTRSPMFSVFGEVLSGVASIRAFGDSARFTKQIFSLLNINNRPFFLLWQTNRWLSVRVDIAGGFVSFSAACFVLYQRDMDAALAGFILSFAIAFNERILWVVRLWSMNEINMNAVERVREYLDLPQESTVGTKPPAIWPSRTGSIVVSNLTASYAPDLDPVLKNVSFSVLPMEKVGICGRTGSGKSTLGLSFFRFIEASSGSIFIDGIDISTIPLVDLRSRLTIVAQEAYMFTGSLRFNLDPFSIYTDAEIWNALQRVQMASTITPAATPGPSRPASPPLRALSTLSTPPPPPTATPTTTTPIVTPTTTTAKGTDAATTRFESSVDGEVEGGVGMKEGSGANEEARFVVKSLEMVVTEGGKNFSTGQRQLLALARGILKLSTSSILILDESTASLDQATDERIQQTIREEMSDATILCIAHRLRTIIDMDKILVLGSGCVLEYDTPWNLLANPSSEFSELCRRSGEFELLVELAEGARRLKVGK